MALMGFAKGSTHWATPSTDIYHRRLAVAWDTERGVAMQEDEARLYCNLIRGYITFLLAEHERLAP
jgi:hypothetical protein